jgi:hypothetical protein
MPSVTLLNMGSIGGPTDGTSTIARAIDDFVDQGHPFVCGVGDDGGNYNHALATLSQGETIDLTLDKNVAGNLRFDLWYEETDRFDITITRPDNTTVGPFPAPATADDQDDRFLNGLNYYHRGANKDFFGAASNRRELLIDITGGTGEYIISLTASSVGGSGMFHATLNPANFAYDNRFTSYEELGTSINDFASAAKAIVPTDYVVKKDWVDMEGNPREMTGQEIPGELWTGSSLGPTQDGRMGVDFAACGEVLYAAYSPNSYYSSNEWLLIQGGDYKYGIQNAVSAAAPLTMGVIALMLEFRPELTPSELKTALQNSARKDQFTDTVANISWGHGKLDAYQAVKEVEGLGVFNGHKEETRIHMYPNPASSLINIDLTVFNQQDIMEITIANAMGQKVFTARPDGFSLLQIDTGDYPNGVYYVMINGIKTVVATGTFIKSGNP